MEENDWNKPTGLCAGGASRYALPGSSSGQVRICKDMIFSGLQLKDV